MKCSKCGYDLLPGDRFCPFCGEKAPAASPADTPAAQAAPAAPQATAQAAPARSAPAPAPAENPPEADPADSIDDLPPDSHVPEGAADPAVAKAREDFIREFVATAPNGGGQPAPKAKKPRRAKRPGRTLMVWDIILCSLAELVIIAYIVSTLAGFALIQPLSMVYPVSALICVVLIEVILLLSAFALRARREELQEARDYTPAAQTPPAPESVPAQPAAPAEKPPAHAAPAASPKPEDAPQTAAPPAEPYGCRMEYTLRGRERGAVLTEFPAIIGRGTIDDETVSVVHCSVNLENGVLTIRDLESANGVYVNGSRISAPTVIRGDDLVIIGRAMVTFRLI